MKRILALAVVFLGLAASGYSMYWNFSIEESPMFLSGIDRSTNLSYATFYNVLSTGVKVNFSDNFDFSVRGKYTYLALTNLTTLPSSNQHRIYVDRVKLEYRDNYYDVMVGRDWFIENNGMIIGNLGDGGRVETSFLNSRQKLIVYHSGLFGTLPRELNQFNFTAEEWTNTGANRLSAAFIWEVPGLLGSKSIALMGHGSFDLSTNGYYQPWTIALYGKGIIVNGLSYNFTGALQLGQATNGQSILGYAGDLTLLWQAIDPYLGLSMEAAYASGDDTNTNNTVENFSTFGKYSTGLVLVPDFSNLFMLQIGAVSRLFSERLTLRADYTFLMRANSSDDNGGAYLGTNSVIGHEIAFKAAWKIDPNLTLFAQAGCLFGGSALSTNTAVNNLENNLYKVIAGINVKF